MISIRYQKNIFWTKILIGFFLILNVYQKARAQDFLYREKLVNIFPNNFSREINCLTFDKHGFIWTGTNAGLYRYDGYSTDPIVFYKKDSFSVTPEVHDIVYNNNHIYLATNQGLYIVETGQESYSAHPYNGIDREPVVHVFSDNDTSIWFLTASGLLGNVNNGKIIKIPCRFPFQPNQVKITSNQLHLFITLEDNMLIAVNKSQYKISWTSKFKQIEAIHGLTTSPNKEILLCTNKDVYTLNNFDSGNPTLSPHPEFGTNVRSIYFADNHIFIVRNNASIDELITKNGRYNLTKIIVNNENNLHLTRLTWYNKQIIIPGRNGIGVIQLTNNYFNTLKPVSNTENGATRGIAEDANYYYLCTYNNIFKQDKHTGKTTDLTSKPLVTHGVFLDKDTLWLATEGNGLIRLNLKTNTVDKIFQNLPEKYRSLICIKPLNNDSLIIGGYKCLFIYNKKNQKVIDIVPQNKLNQKLSNGFFRDIHIINNNQIVVATPNGVYKMQLDGKIIKDFNQINSYKSTYNTFCIWLNNKKQIWTGTTEGIVIYDSSGEFLTNIGVQNGLAGNKIASMTPDLLGNLWIGTYSGLSRISTSDLSIKNYYTNDGLPDNEFNHSSFCIDQNGAIILGTMKGFIRFEPKNIIVTNKTNSTIIVSKLEREIKGIINNQLLTNTKPTNFVELGKEIKYLKIYFCRLPIQFFSEINFNYKILKLITQNVDISDKPMITLTDSEPGKYDIEITLNDGNGSNGIFNKIITYQIVEYFYFNKWFYLTSTLIFLLLVIGYLYTLVIQKNKNLSVRNEIARDLHDEIGGSLTAISLYTELLREDKPPTKKQIESIQQTTKKLLISFRDALWTLNTSSDTAIQLWDHIKDMVSDIAGNLNMDVNYEQIDSLNDIKLTLKMKQSLLLVLKEAINNAIKHGDHKYLNLKWILENGKYIIIISNSINNSTTNNKFTLSTGIGLNSMQQRMKKIGGAISYISTTDEFQIKIHLNFLK